MVVEKNKYTHNLGYEYYDIDTNKLLKKTKKNIHNIKIYGFEKIKIKNNYYIVEEIKMDVFNPRPVLFYLRKNK